MNLLVFDSKIDMWNFESVDYSMHRRNEARSAVVTAVEEQLTAEANRGRERKPG
jgi:hypothetical protein